MLTTKEISATLNVSEETVRRWIRNHDLKARQEGKSYLVTRDDLIEFVEKKAAAGTSTSIGKMASLLPIAGVVVGGAAASISKIIKMIDLNAKSAVIDKQASQTNIEKQSLEEIEDYINTLKRQKKKLELEYQMNLLQIDEEIEKYQKIKQKIETEDKSRN